MEKPVVSCVMAVYNPEERFLREAIESILSQTYPVFEFIIVDDGSEGEILDVLRSYKDWRIKIFTIPHGGLSRALNFGIRQASARYIARQDADDLSLPHRFEVQVSFLERYPEIHLIGTFSLLINEEGEPLNPIILPVNPHEVRKSLLKFNHIIHGSVMIRRSTLEEVGMYDERYKIGQDYDLWFRISERYPIMNIPQVLYKMRHYKKSLARRNPDLFQSQVKLVKREANQRMKKDMEGVDLERMHLPIKRGRRKKIRCLLLNTYIHDSPSIISDIIDAFHALGHKIKPLTLPSLLGLKLKILSEEMKGFKPDFIFSINSIHLTAEILDFFSKSDVPVAIWYVGAPNFEEGLGTSNAVVFVFDRFYMESVKQKGFRKVLHLPLATNPRVFTKLELEEKIDVAFCGDSLYPFYLNYKMILKKMGNSLMDFFDEILLRYARSPILDVKQLLKLIEKKLRCKIHFQSKERETSFFKTLDRAATCLYRKALLSCLSKPYIYGDYGWCELDREGFAGFVKTREEMAELYNSVKVNLNITDTQLKTALSHSLLDILACERFVLTDYRKDLEEFFDLDRELACFKDENEFKEKIRYYLGHPGEREEMKRRASEKVLAYHTYKERIKKIITTLRE